MKIGLTQRILTHNGFSYDCTSQHWYSFLAGHTIVPIPNDPCQDFDKLSSEIDALIITGGDDSPQRRLTEIRIAQRMLLQRKPILGICHGAFLLTHLCGGEVVDIAGHYGTEHQIICDGEEKNVNSYHTIAIKRPPVGATVIATCDGVCEAWIDDNISAIVWHIERMKSPVIPNKIREIFKWNI